MYCAGSPPQAGAGLPKLHQPAGSWRRIGLTTIDIDPAVDFGRLRRRDRIVGLRQQVPVLGDIAEVGIAGRAAVQQIAVAIVGERLDQQSPSRGCRRRDQLGQPAVAVIDQRRLVALRIGHRGPVGAVGEAGRLADTGGRRLGITRDRGVGIVGDAQACAIALGDRVDAVAGPVIAVGGDIDLAVADRIVVGA